MPRGGEVRGTKILKQCRWAHGVPITGRKSDGFPTARKSALPLVSLRRDRAAHCSADSLRDAAADTRAAHRAQQLRVPLHLILQLRAAAQLGSNTSVMTVSPTVAVTVIVPHQHEDIHEVADFLQRDAAIADYRSATRLPSCSHDLTAQPAG